MMSIREFLQEICHSQFPMAVANIVQFLSNNSTNSTHPNADTNSKYVFASQLKFCEQILHELGRGGNQSILIAILF